MSLKVTMSCGVAGCVSVGMSDRISPVLSTGLTVIVGGVVIVSVNTDVSAIVSVVQGVVVNVIFRVMVCMAIVAYMTVLVDAVVKVGISIGAGVNTSFIVRTDVIVREKSLDYYSLRVNSYGMCMGCRTSGLFRSTRCVCGTVVSDQKNEEMTVKPKSSSSHLFSHALKLCPSQRVCWRAVE